MQLESIFPPPCMIRGTVPYFRPSARRIKKKKMNFNDAVREQKKTGAYGSKQREAACLPCSAAAIKSSSTTRHQPAATAAAPAVAATTLLMYTACQYYTEHQHTAVVGAGCWSCCRATWASRRNIVDIIQQYYRQ